MDWIKGVLLEIVDELDGGSFADFGGDVQGVGVVFDVGESHAGAEAHFSDFLGGGGVALLHGLVDVRNARAFVGKDDFHVVLFQIHENVATISVRHNVDFRFIQRHDSLFDDFGAHSDFLEHPLHLTGCGSCVGEIPALNMIFKIHNVRFWFIIG